MTSWIKQDHVPIYWPPKMDDLYETEDPIHIRITYVLTGWIVFTVIYGILIFSWFWVILQWYYATHR